nr:MAG TPA: hypothetical protein [Caudoviricetes sp.]
MRNKCFTPFSFYFISYIINMIILSFYFSLKIFNYYSFINIKIFPYICSRII